MSLKTKTGKTGQPASITIDPKKQTAASTRGLKTEARKLSSTTATSKHRPSASAIPTPKVLSSTKKLPGMPLKSLWEVLQDASLSADAILDNVLDPRYGLECETDGNTPLMLATKAGRLDVMKALIGAGAEVTKLPDRSNHKLKLVLDVFTPLSIANETRNLEAVEVLLAAYVERGYPSPLFEAAQKNNLWCAEALVSLGADVNAVDSLGNTVLHQVIRKDDVGKYYSFVCLLIANGADISATDSYGCTPLHYAAAGRSPNVKLLLDHGAAPNAKIRSGETPLHYAASRGSVECAQLLLRRGADLHAKDSNGGSPLCLAKSNSHHSFVDFFLERH